MRGRTMRRTPDRFPQAIEEQMLKYGYTKNTLAKKLGVTVGAINFWLKGCKINRKNLAKIKEVLNLEMVYTEELTPQEAVATVEIMNEQLSIDLDGDDEETEEDATAKWINVYNTSVAGTYKMRYEDVTFLIVRQKYEDRKSNVPFVAIAIHGEES